MGRSCQRMGFLDRQGAMVKENFFGLPITGAARVPKTREQVVIGVTPATITGAARVPKTREVEERA